jgi:hypothetical protein
MRFITGATRLGLRYYKSTLRKFAAGFLSTLGRYIPCFLEDLHYPEQL